VGDPAIMDRDLPRSQPKRRRPYPYLAAASAAATLLLLLLLLPGCSLAAVEPVVEDIGGNSLAEDVLITLDLHVRQRVEVAAREHA
jgi:hypothetical protein